MSALREEVVLNSIYSEIKAHSAWKGNVSGLVAEKMLREKNQPYLYLLRAGESESDHQADYYVTFLDSDLTVRHQPFVISSNYEGWFYENGSGGGPYKECSIEEVLHLIMHCSKDEVRPFTRFNEQA